MALGFGLAGLPALADETGDDITVNDTGDGETFSVDSANTQDDPVDPTRAVDDDFVSFYSIGESGEVIIAFTDNVALADGTSDPDVTIWDRCGNATVNNADEPVDVDVSQGGAFTNDVVMNTTSDGGAAMPAGLDDFLICPIDIDLDAVSLAGATQVRVTDLCDPLNETETLGCDASSGGIDIAEVEALNSLAFGTANIMKTVMGDSDITETGSNSGFDDQQTFVFEIVVENPNGEDLTGLTFMDTVPAEFDIVDAVADNTNSPTNAGCTDVAHAEGGAKGKGKGGQKLAPDHVTFNVDLAAGESCRISVEVATDDDHPGGGNSPDWTPTSCPLGEELPLNDGVEVFDAETGDLIFRDDSTLGLTCSHDAPA